MRASRAPGPVQSYAILHNQKATGPASQAAQGKKGKSTIPQAANQGIARKFIDLDDIPDFPSDEVEWGKMPAGGKAVATAPASFTQRGLHSDAHQPHGFAYNHHHVMQPQTAPHVSIVLLFKTCVIYNCIHIFFIYFLYKHIVL